MDELEAKLERIVRDRMMESAVTMTFHGTLRVDPNKVYIDRKTGQRAVESLRRCLMARSTTMDERQRDLEAAEWACVESERCRNAAKYAGSAREHGRLIAEAEHYERAAAALRERAERAPAVPVEELEALLRYAGRWGVDDALAALIAKYRREG